MKLSALHFNKSIKGKEKRKIKGAEVEVQVWQQDYGRKKESTVANRDGNANNAAT